MTKRVLVSIFVLGSLYMASPVMAEGETCVTTHQYGGGTQTVCGAKHEAVDTGLADINPVILASVFFALSGASLLKAKKIKRAEVVL